MNIHVSKESIIRKELSKFLPVELFNVIYRKNYFLYREKLS